MRPGLYFPLPRQPASSLTLALRTRVEPRDLAGPARTLVRERSPVR